MRALPWMLIPLLAVGFAAVGVARPAPLQVASLSTVLSDVARNVGGNHIELLEIVGPGVDPHDFQPSPGDIQRVAGADLTLVSGRGLEGYLSKLEESSGGKNGKFLDVGASLKLVEEGKSIGDPHWWHSVANVKKAVAVVRDALTKANPADKDAYAANAAAYLTRLDALERAVRLKAAELPREKRKLVTSHDAFQYFCRDYGFKVYPIEGVSTAEEPSTRKVAGLLKTIKQEKVKAVFFENMENPKIIAEITKETGAKVGGELYADGLGKEPDAATYEAMMRHNVATIVDALK